VWIYKNASGFQEKVNYVMVKDAATNIWSKTASVATLQNTYGITGTVYYGYRAWGPNWTYNASWTKGSTLGYISDVDSQGNRFNPNKLLLDPYAREVSHDPQTPTMNDGTIYASGAYRAIDNGASAPKGIVLASDATSIGTKPTRALKDDVVYEVHVRGLTMNDTSRPSAARTRVRAPRPRTWPPSASRPWSSSRSRRRRTTPSTSIRPRRRATTTGAT
jgi:isoamylase